MSKCKNCGHDSHCGIPLRKSVDNSNQYDSAYKDIEVCKSCRCEQCTRPDWG